MLHIHEFRSTLTIPAARLAREMSLPYVLSPHGGLRHLGKHLAKRTFDRLWGESILDHAAAVLVLSANERADALSFRVHESRIFHLPNALDVSEYAALPRPDAFRKRWNLTAAKIILFLGRLNRIKGIDVLIEAFLSLRQQQKDVQLVLAGPDDGEGRHIPKRNDILLTGYLDQREKLEALSAADVVVLPSRSEASPVVLFEALLCRRPVIVSSACELPMTMTGRRHNNFEEDYRTRLAPGRQDHDVSAERLKSLSRSKILSAECSNSRDVAARSSGPARTS